jgi:hypothetical protein
MFYLGNIFVNKKIPRLSITNQFNLIWFNLTKINFHQNFFRDSNYIHMFLIAVSILEIAFNTTPKLWTEIFCNCNNFCKFHRNHHNNHKNNNNNNNSHNNHINQKMITQSTINYNTDYSDLWNRSLPVLFYKDL